MTAILGLNACHTDSVACLVVDGGIVGAVEEERFIRAKHWAGFPEAAIKWCLARGGLRLEDVDHVAINRDPRANLARKVRYVAAHRPAPKLVLERLANMRSWLSIEDELRSAFPGQELRAAGAPRRAPPRAPRLRLPHLPVQGGGRRLGGRPAATSSRPRGGLGRGGEVSIDGRVHFPHSLGILRGADDVTP